jgi:hypothetical protein
MRSLFLLFVLASACAAQKPKSAKPAAPVRNIAVQELPALVSRVRSLRALPATLALRIGQTIDLDSIHVIAMDAEGRDIGRLPAFDFGIKPGEPASVVPRTIKGERAGETTLTVRYPNSAWGKRLETRPFATVHIIVRK